jgi:uncharacterized protein (TIGR02001 family)
MQTRAKEKKMKKIMTITLAAALAGSSAMAGGLLGIDFANAYIYRGVTVADDFVIQPNVELSGFGMPEEYGAFTVGAWAVKAPGGEEILLQDTFFETDWYVAYSLPEFVEGLDLYVGLTEYTYKAADDESELNLGAAFELGEFALGGSVNYMYDNQVADATEGQVYVDLTADYEIELSEEFSGIVGGLVSYLKQGDGNGSGPGALDDGLSHFEIYGALDYDLSEMWSIYGSLAYIGQIDDEVLPDAGALGVDGHNVEVLGVIGVGCEL